MDTANKASLLQKMLLQLAPDVFSLAAPADVHESFAGAKSSAGPASVADTNAGLQKVRENRAGELTAPEISNLEAIVMPYNRPVAFVRGNSYDDLTAPWARLNEAPVKRDISSLFASIGRIELPNSTDVPYAGTGFVTGDGLLMTNRHVAELFSHGLGTTIMYRTGSSAVHFRRQVDTSADDDAQRLNVVGVEMIHPYWDMALLRVEGLSSPKLPLSFTSPDDLVGDDVVVVGYPARDYRNDLDVQDRIFEKIYNVKRIQPGALRQRTGLVSSFTNQVNALIHDASTLGGNSGSAVIHVKSGTVVGLHFGGSYLIANYAVPVFDLVSDPRVAKTLNLSDKVKPTTLYDGAWTKTSVEVQVTVKDDPMASVQQMAASPPPVNPQTPSTATFTIPLQVTVSIGTPSMSLPQALAQGAITPPGKRIGATTEAVPAPDFELARAINAYVPLLVASYQLAAQTPVQFPGGYSRLADVRVNRTEAIDIESTLTPEQRQAVERDSKALSKGASAETLESLADPSAFGFVAQEDKTGALLISIRGTQTPAEWLADFVPVPVPFFESPGMGLVHVGFAVFYRKVRASIQAVLANFDSGVRITVVGHSLGGAMAVLCAADIERNMGKKNVDVCTFGGPRTGKIDFRIHFNNEIARCFRVVDALDIVPHVPSVITGWNHVGVEIDVNGKGGSSPHSLDAYLDGLRKLAGGGGNEAVSTNGQVLSVQVA